VPATAATNRRKAKAGWEESGNPVENSGEPLRKRGNRVGKPGNPLLGSENGLSKSGYQLFKSANRLFINPDQLSNGEIHVEQRKKEDRDKESCRTTSIDDPEATGAPLDEKSALRN